MAKLGEKLYSWLEDLVVMLPNLILAGLVMASGIFAARYLERLLRSVLLKVTRNEPISRLASSVAHMAAVATTSLGRAACSTSTRP